MKLHETAAYELPSCGVHVARCIRCIDLGTQSSNFAGETKAQRKLQVTFELLGEEKQTNGEPFLVSRRFTASMNEKSSLRGFVESWLGRKLIAADFNGGFDIGDLLNRHAQLNLVETERDGKKYVNIQSITPLPKGMAVPGGHNEVVFFDLDGPDWTVFESLSQGLKDAISQSPEYQKLTSASTAGKWKPVRELSSA